MRFFDKLRSLFASESAEARRLGHETRTRMEADLERREAELEATPSERIEMLQDRIAEDDAAFDDLRDEIERRSARAETIEELTDPAETVDPETVDPEAADHPDTPPDRPA